MTRSLAVSVALTQSPGPFSTTSRAVPNASRTTSPPACAATVAASRSASRSSAAVTTAPPGAPRPMPRSPPARMVRRASRVRGDQISPAGVDHARAGFATHEQAAEVVPRRVHVAEPVEVPLDVTGGDVAQRQRRRPEGAELLPRQRPIGHSRQCDQRVLDTRRGRWRERDAVEECPCSPNRGEPGSRWLGWRRARTAGRPRRARTARSPSTGCYARSSSNRRPDRARR